MSSAICFNLGQCKILSSGNGLTLKGVLHGSVVNCLTRNPGVLDSNLTGSSGFFMGVSLGKTHPPLPSTSETQVRHVSFRWDMTEILSKAL